MIGRKMSSVPYLIGESVCGVRTLGFLEQVLNVCFVF